MQIRDDPFDGVRQFCAVLEERQNEDTLRKLCDANKFFSRFHQAIIYCDGQRSAMKTSTVLGARISSVSIVHEKMKEDARDRILNEFLSGKSRILITTDWLPHGLDFPLVELVINYGFPQWQDINEYQHRIGHAGRFGRRGIAVNLFRCQDEKERIERHYNIRIDPMPPTTDIFERLVADIV